MTEWVAAVAVSLTSAAAGGAVGALVTVLMVGRRPRPAAPRAARRRPHTDVAPAHPVLPEVIALEARPARVPLPPAPVSHDTRLEIMRRDWGGPR